MRVLQTIKDYGFKGVSVQLHYWIDVDTDTVFSQYGQPNRSHPHLFSPQDWMLEGLLEFIRDVGLDADVRIELHIPNPDQVNNCVRDCYHPKSVETFFESNKQLLLRLGAILERTDADVFSIFTELLLCDQYSELTKDTLDAVASVFSGELLVEQATNLFIRKYPEMLEGDMARYEAASGTYWDWEDEETGREVMIGYSYWQFPENLPPSSNFEAVSTSDVVNMWRNVVNYHREEYPGHRIVFAEVGLNYDGDVEKMANTWDAYLSGFRELDVDGFSLWSISINNWLGSGGSPAGVALDCDHFDDELILSRILPYLE